MPLLTRQEILARIKAGTPEPTKHPTGIWIDPYKEDSIGSVDYRLTSARVHYTGAFHPGDGVIITRQERIVNLDEAPFLIQPGWFVQLEAAETIVLGERIFGTFGVITSRLNAAGVLVQCGHLTPEYTGKLLFGLYNAGSDAFRIEKNDTFVRIYFTEVDHKIDPMGIEEERLAKLKEERDRNEQAKEIQALESTISELQTRLKSLKGT